MISVIGAGEAKPHTGPVNRTASHDLLESLSEAGLVYPQAARAVMQDPRFEKMPLPQALVEGKLIEEEELARFMADLFGLPFVHVNTFELRPELLALIPRAQCVNSALLPLRLEDGGLVVAVADPFDVFVDDLVRSRTPLPTSKVVAPRREILAALEGGASELANSLAGFGGGAAAQQLELQAATETAEELPEEYREHDAPIVELVAALIVEAIKLKASDIHVEPQATCLRVRYRIDGVLRVMGELPKKIQNAVLSRIKLASGMDISEKRRPQDGRSQARVAGRWIDLRVSAMPSHFGEKIVLRILDKNVGVLQLERLGMLEADYELYKRLLTAPQGMIILTGPTGSGKTTTLYASLNLLNSTEQNIVTVEDPIEFQLAGVIQTQVHAKAGVTFASALRTILRQDPDTVMVGEIRDLETAEMAFQAAQTGHFVLSTLHTNSAPASITRLAYMGVAPYLVASSLLGVVAQRLVRRICPKCVREARLEAATLDYLRAAGVATPTNLLTGGGCEACGHTGFSGRLGLYEILPMTQRLQNLVYGQATQDQVNAAAREEGLSTLLADGLRKVELGWTSLAEVLRVVPLG